MTNTWHKINTTKKSLPYLMSLCGLVLIFLISALLTNRSMMFGTFIGILFVNIEYNKISLVTAKQKMLLCLIFLIFITGLILFIEPASSTGRILIYKISYKIFLDNYSLGIGVGKFPGVYGQYQAEYFRTGVYNQTEFLNADNVFFAFNDYFQFIIERGVFGLLLVTAFFTLLFVTTKRSLKINPGDHVLRFSTAILITVLSAALTTHVLDSYLYVGIASVAIIYMFLSQFRYKSVRNRLVTLAVSYFIVALIPTFLYLKNLRIRQELDRADQLAAMGYVFESKSICDSLWPQLKDDLDFLLLYANSFQGSVSAEKYADVLKRILARRYDYNLMIRLGKTYEKMGNMKQALAFYKEAVNIVPNRFRSRFILFDFYTKTRQLNRAKAQGAFILKMPVKVQSKDVDGIKDYVKIQLKNINKVYF